MGIKMLAVCASASEFTPFIYARKKRPFRSARDPTTYVFVAVNESHAVFIAPSLLPLSLFVVDVYKPAPMPSASSVQRNTFKCPHAASFLIAHGFLRIFRVIFPQFRRVPGARRERELNTVARIAERRNRVHIHDKKKRPHTISS